MAYINAGCFDKNGKRIPTKKQLKEMLKADPESVVFDKTAIYDGAGTLQLHELGDGEILSVVGPDPFRDRKWYASVRKVNGRVKVA
jgi:hypothetical protein